MIIIKDNFELIVHSFDDSITVVPLSDLHLGASNCMINEIKKIVKMICDNPNMYCTLGGDILDNGVLVGKNLGVFDGISPMKAINMAVEILRPLAENNKILGVISGNHESRSEKVTDMNPLYMVCCELGIQDLYRSSLAIIMVNLGSRKSTNQCYTILLHHGKGTAESALKKDKEFLGYFSGIDIEITGHTHQGRVTRDYTYDVNKFAKKVTKRKRTYIVTNSFLEDAEYGLKNMLIGADNSIISFELKCKREKEVPVHWY